MTEPDPHFDPIATSDYLNANGYSLAAHRNSLPELFLRVLSMFAVLFLCLEIYVMYRNKKQIK